MTNKIQGGKFTSLCRDGYSNLQLNYFGMLPEVESDFLKMCQSRDVTWAHLFEEGTGRRIGTYTKDNGFTAVC